MKQASFFEDDEDGYKGDPEDGLPLQPRAHARNTDPETSHEAARSIPSENIRETQKLVLRLLRTYGPMIDYETIDKAQEEGLTVTRSGMRTRRGELVRMGLVENTGERRPTETGCSAIVWRAVEQNTEEERDVHP